MKKNEVILSGLSLIIIFLIVWGMAGCSAKYHLNMYQSKGGICGNVDTISIVDSFPVIHRDTVIWKYFHRDSFFIVNDRVIPQTRYELRTEYKMHRDTIRLRETIIKEQRKIEKGKARQKAAPWKVIIICVIIGLFALFLIRTQK